MMKKYVLWRRKQMNWNDDDDDERRTDSLLAQEPKCWKRKKWKKNDQITGKTTRMRNEELSPCGPLPRRLMDNHNQLTEGTTKIRTQRNSTQQKTTAQDDDGLSLYSEKTNKTMAATPVPLSRWLKNASIMQQHKQQQQQQQNRPNVKK